MTSRYKPTTPPRPIVDLTGKTFGLLSVQGRGKAGHWHVICVCGTSKQIRTDNLLHDLTRSCGSGRCRKLLRLWTERRGVDGPLWEARILFKTITE